MDANIRKLDDDDIEPRPDRGVTTIEILTWSALMVVVIVAMTALLQALGADVIGYIRDQIGI
jgi:hypothetical protein